MKAVEIQNQSLVLCELDIPEPSSEEILIEVKAAGVNRPDVLQRMGLYPPPKGVTDIPGLEISGVVKTDGIMFKKGDEICALVAGGAYAEYVCAPEAQCLPKPKALSFEQAAALPECLFTVWRNVFDIADLKKGENILIHGGSSGIGSFAIQLAKQFGANVYTTAGNDEKIDKCLELGATKAINYKHNDFEEQFDGIGFDIVLDMVGGNYLKKNIALMKHGGRIVMIAFLNGKIGQVDIPQIMRKQIKITGSTLRASPVEEKKLIRDQLLDKVWPIIEKGRILPVIDRVYDLKDAWKAHVRMESSKHIGKIVLNVSSD